MRYSFDVIFKGKKYKPVSSWIRKKASPSLCPVLGRGCNLCLKRGDASSQSLTGLLALEGDTSSYRNWILDYGLCRNWCSKYIASRAEKKAQGTENFGDSRTEKDHGDQHLQIDWFSLFFVCLLVYFYRAIVNLQCCFSFEGTAKWFSYTYVYSYTCWYTDPFPL